MNIDFAVEALRQLALFRYGRIENEAVGSKRLHGTDKEEEECKRPRKQTKETNQGNKLRPDINCSRNGMSASEKAAHNMLHCFWRNFSAVFFIHDFSRWDFSRRKQNRGVWLSFIENDF